MDPNSGLLSSPSRVHSQPAEPSMEGRRSPLPCEQGTDSSFPWAQVPNSSLTDPDWFWDEHIRAKRARVETIVQGMGLSLHSLVPSRARARESPSCPEKAGERKRKQSLPMQQISPKPGPAGNQGSRTGGPRLREQLHLLKHQLRQLQERILQAAKPGDTAGALGGAQKQRGPPSIKQRNGYGCGPWARDRDHDQGSRGDLPGVESHRAAEVEFQPEGPRSLPSGTRALLEILRKELTGAVSQAVDSVLQKVLLDPPSRLAQLGRSVQGLVPEGRRETLPEGGTHEDPLPPAAVPRQAQAQAGGPSGHLPLAKPLDSPRHPVSPRITSKPYQAPPVTYPLTVPPHIQENQILSQLLDQGSSGHWSGRLPQDLSSPSHCSEEPALRPWGAVRLRPSVVSRQQPPVTFTPTHWETLPFLPSVKTEQGGLRAVTDVLPFSSVHIQEGLNPSHLKKAKLMFFFTRYPSSSLLKAYFPDVQFNRCVTSQMIKWFSNFREFYYIQMEKFARQAISDGVVDPEVLVVLRDSELFRALNMHYNKGSDFEVPDCFLDVASLTLQEFFRAVSAGKDSDPSWKKPIYKVISKLDSDLPETFKSPSCP
ncbi:prospero homeobox protein 2 isoform X1 [Sturnira hondurensis]|uniref:prospero homeobox protein 2 isoform X1 n=1 Tax=Sturnira hondurensis TaxID=192404 RepID=UPI00187AF5FA|nr:prospero homeobox protein 2 isoform X1 [Sturnira hondurensis]